MRRANFKLPNEKHLRTETSTYKNYISDKTQGVNYASAAAESMNNLKKSNVTIG